MMSIEQSSIEVNQIIFNELLRNKIPEIILLITETKC